MNRAAAGAGFLALAVGAMIMIPPQTGGNDTPDLLAAGPGGACVITTPGAPAGTTGSASVPVVGTFAMTSEYGWRSFRGAEFHAGLDFAAPGSPPVLAVAPGTVTLASAAGSAGNMVQIDHGDGVESQSMHLSRIDVAKGESVVAGQQIGVQGSTGDSTGPHLHLAVRVGGATVDPRAWLSARGVTLPAPGATGTGASGPTAGGPRTAVSPRCDEVALAAGGADVKPGTVPEAYRPWVLKAGQTCAASPPALLAAQIEAESGWNANAVSPVGAVGPSQFMPATWAAYGRDEDGNGRVSPTDIGDAVMAQARYNCAVAKLVGGVSGDSTDLMLAGYNAGPGAVIAFGGVPPYGETVGYVRKIRAGMLDYTP